MPKLPYIFQSVSMTQVLGTVKFGMPSRDCRNVGICKIEVIKNAEQLMLVLQPENVRSALAFLTLSLNVIECSFFKSTIHPKTERELFNNNYFEIREAFYFTSDLTGLFRESEMTIPPDYYPLSEYEGFYSFSFPLTPLNKIKNSGVLGHIHLKNRKQRLKI